MSNQSGVSKSIGLVPLVVGLWYLSVTFQLTSGISGDSLQLGYLAGLIGGIASVLIGIGILFGIGEFDTSVNTSNQQALIGLCLVAGLLFAAGVGVQVGL